MTIEATLERIAVALERLVTAEEAALAAAIKRMESTGEPVAPKASRGKKAAAPAESSTAAIAEQTAAPANTAAPASPSNDMFAEEASSPKGSTVTATEASSATSKSPSAAGKSKSPSAAGKSKSPSAAGKSKAPTLDEVRAAMVDVQTKCGGKAAAQGLLIEFTTDKKPLYSALPEEKYGALIAACKELVAKAK